jgi:broad specificity phosphatase PhoE
MIPGSKLLYLIRHAQSEANVARLHGGPHHPLTEQGKAQAAFVAERCAKLPLQTLCASDALRAQQTAEIIAAHTGITMQTMPDLCEVRMPSHMMERRFDTQEAIEAEESLIMGMRPGFKQTDEESFDEMVARAARVLNTFASMSEQHIGVVTHGLFLRCLVGNAVFGTDITPRELLSLWRGLKSENTGLSILEYRPDTPKRLWRLFVWNDHAHLG